MAGMFDDLIPAQATAPAAPAGGMFDDLIPAAPATRPGRFGGSYTVPQSVPDYAPGEQPLTSYDPNAQGRPTSQIAGENEVKLGRLSTRSLANLPFSDRARAAFETATGIGGTQGDYSGNLAATRAADAAAAAADPQMERAAQLASAVALPAPGVGWALKGAGLVGKAARGAMAGMGLGALEGASATPDLTDVQHALPDVLKGGAVGGLIGGAIPVGGRAIGAAATALGNRFAPAVSNMGNRVADYLTQRMVADEVARTGGQTINSVIDRLGSQGTLADTGPNMLSAAQGAAGLTEHPEAMGEVRQFFGNRAQGTNARFNADINANIGPDVSPQVVSDALQAQRSQLHKGLPQVFANTPVMDASGPLATVGQKLNTAVGAEANVLNRVRRNLMDELPDGSLLPTTSSEKIHNTKMDLDTLIKHGDPTLGVAPGMFSKTQGTIGQVRGEINQAIRDQVPGYANINIPSSQLASVMDAIKAGRDKVLATGPNALHPDYYSGQFSQLTPGQQEGQRIGLAGNIYRSVGTNPNDAQALSTVFQSKPSDTVPGWNEQKLATAFGNQPIANLQNARAREATFGATSGKIGEGSQTDPRAQAVAATRAAIAPRMDWVPGSLQNVTALGGPLELGRKGINLIGRALQNPGVPAQMANELAGAVTRTGPALREMARQLQARSAALGNSQAAGQGVEYLSNLAAALLANEHLADQQRVR